MTRHTSRPGHDALEPNADHQGKNVPDAVEAGNVDARKALQSGATAQDARPKAAGGSAGEPAESGKPRAGGNSPVQQSDAPVDVPRTPDKPTSQTEDVAAEESKPPKNPDDGSVWADTELPAPNKKGVRPQWF